MSDENPVTQPLNRKDKTIILPGEHRRKIYDKAQDKDESSLVTKQKTLMLFILGMAERLDFSKSDVITLGRFDTRLKTDDQLDLASYGAVERGVSRLHCQLELIDDEVVVTDLGSSNGTYVSGNRLDPNQPYTLKKGEELVLGRLPIQVVARR